MSNDLQNTQTSMTVEEVRGSLDSTDNGAVKNSIRNCLTVFQNDPKLEGAIRYNILTERIDIVKPLWWSKPTTTLNDTDLNYLMLYLEDQYTLTSEKKIQKAISIVADCNKYHPIRDYLNGLEWDGTERIRCALPHFLGAEESEFTYECLRLFMLGAISRVFKPGSKFETMLCLVGGQGAGKSTFFRLLAIKDEWFSDDLKRIDDDNVYRKMQGHWIIEMSEMIATANAKSIEDIKSFISRAKETYKVPYETHPADRLRQCVFGGSSNTMDFLPLDRSGNRRFLPIMVHPERAEVHILEDEAASRAYIDLMWAEAMTIYRRGSFRLTLSMMPYSSLGMVCTLGRPMSSEPCASSMEPRNVYSEATMMPGLAMGSVTIRNVRSGEAPTSRALSSCWICTVRNAPEGIHTMNIIVFTMCTSTTPANVPIRFSL